jgi:hypothetical protein
LVPPPDVPLLELLLVELPLLLVLLLEPPLLLLLPTVVPPDDPPPPQAARANAVMATATSGLRRMIMMAPGRRFQRNQHSRCRSHGGLLPNGDDQFIASGALTGAACAGPVWCRSWRSSNREVWSY